jgi:cell division protein FtsB
MSLEDRFTGDSWYISHLELERDHDAKKIARLNRTNEKLNDENDKLRSEVKRLMGNQKEKKS